MDKNIDTRQKMQNYANMAISVMNENISTKSLSYDRIEASLWLANALHIVETKNPLFKSHFEVWERGITLPELYYSLSIPNIDYIGYTKGRDTFFYRMPDSNSYGYKCMVWAIKSLQAVADDQIANVVNEDPHFYAKYLDKANLTTPIFSGIVVDWGEIYNSYFDKWAKVNQEEGSEDG